MCSRHRLLLVVLVAAATLPPWACPDPARPRAALAELLPGCVRPALVVPPSGGHPPWLSCLGARRVRALALLVELARRDEHAAPLLRRCRAALTRSALTVGAGDRLWLRAASGARGCAPRVVPLPAGERLAWGLPLDVNRSGFEELLALPGVGPTLARRILRYRVRHGPYVDLAALGAVRGVGPATLRRLRRWLSFGR